MRYTLQPAACRPHAVEIDAYSQSSILPLNARAMANLHSVRHVLECFVADFAIASCFHLSAV